MNDLGGGARVGRKPFFFEKKNQKTFDLWPRLSGEAAGKLPDLRQAESAECGLACLAMISRHHGRRLDLNTLRREHPVSLKGMTLKSLMDTAGHLGLTGRPLRLEVAQLGQLRLPAILHWDMSHFVVLASCGRTKVTVHDPAIGVRRYRMDEVSQHFTGVALEITPHAGYAAPVQAPIFSLRDAVGPVRGLASALAQTLILSLILQLYIIASPLFMQLVVDEAVARSDADLVLVLACGFGLFLAINTGAALIRTHVLAAVNAALAFQMGARLFRHLLSLPMSYFERRHVGELVSRFGSLDPIRKLLAEGFATALIDGAMALLTAAMIFIIAPRLAAIGSAVFIGTVVLRVIFYHMLRRRFLDFVTARARETSTFLETMRAMQSIRIFGRETERGAVWMNRYAELVQAETSLVSLRAGFATINDLVFGAENILIVALGAHAVLAGRMSVGMLFAFVAYKQQFVAKASRLVEQAIEFRMLDLHLDRLSDIAHATPEPGAGTGGPYQRPVEGRLEVRNLSYRHAPGEPCVFENISFAVGAGDYVAVTGPSGGGKTTLLKVILGLLPASGGEVLIDGRPLALVGAAHFREHVGVVMQDDQLMSGTIADNICFFDERSDLAHMMHCAQLACVHDEIMDMPMGYNSLIGDMGTSLSGGQRQRVLLARALYRNPRLLFIDEGTSNLDVRTEQRVNEAIGGLKLTRFVIAHRPETIRSAARVLRVDDAGVREVSMLADAA
jgi:ATP-binding cassette subfamily B protein RaxB